MATIAEIYAASGHPTADPTAEYRVYFHFPVTLANLQTKWVTVVRNVLGDVELDVLYGTIRLALSEGRIRFESGTRYAIAAVGAGTLSAITPGGGEIQTEIV